ncbi:6-phosphogluconolactonase [Actinotalea sp.]|uniref:6-phosphogluconolactonase n=1 Tax=Actinotalea sp. TaxID=1872145 RepID=UPI002C4B71C0|nr:6-phosphogluconolactonase [Actinotalea sp.]HQY33275.1 6-phosphogluconolactonase [Actinotalea sp.]HRA50575.1 6-phosphogluconolactonase [Actinotalea sp.]
MSAPTVVVHPDATTVARATAARLLVHLLDEQSTHRPVHVVLTGGTVGIATLAEVCASPLRDAVDWTGVHLWWGDERFLPTGHPDRNETQARTALLDALAVPAANVHPMAGPGAPGITTPEDSAAAYAADLARFAPEPDGDDHGPAGAVPAFDVVLLGMGPDGHVASLFPGHLALAVDDRSAVGVHGSPKPPPLRVSLTFAALAHARQVWVVAAGAEKADAVARALAGDDVTRTPAGHVAGRDRTLWLLDLAAAG